MAFAGNSKAGLATRADGAMTQPDGKIVTGCALDLFDNLTRD